MAVWYSNGGLNSGSFVNQSNSVAVYWKCSFSVPDKNIIQIPHALSNCSQWESEYQMGPISVII